MKRIFFVLLIFVALVCVFLTPCFAAAETTAAELVDWDSPSELVGYRYFTRSGSSWASDLPASPITTPVTFLFSRGGFDSGEGAGTVLVLQAGAVYYIDYSSSNNRYTLHYKNPGASSYTNVSVRGYDSSLGISYYTNSATVTTFGGDTLQGMPVNGGGGFISSGVEDSVGILGTIVHYIFTSPVILVVIGLAVGVTLIGWGIGKVKSTVKGY